MKQPKVEIELNKVWAKSHVYINGEEIPALSIEIEPMSGEQQLVKAKIGVMVDLIKIDPASVEWIEHKTKRSANDRTHCPYCGVTFEEAFPLKVTSSGGRKLGVMCNSCGKSLPVNKEDNAAIS